VPKCEMETQKRTKTSLGPEGKSNFPPRSVSIGPSANYKTGHSHFAATMPAKQLTMLEARGSFLPPVEPFAIQSLFTVTPRAAIDNCEGR
jgi:hypothetical protein